jgi:hypothetical protein
MPHDISDLKITVRAARTARGMVFVDMDPEEGDSPPEEDLVIVRNAAGELIVARMIGPVAGDAPEGESWRISGRYRVDARGVPLTSIVTAPAPTGPDTEGHDWGALGLPNGLDTCVQSADEPSGVDELTLARTSSGHRHGEGTLLLRLAPGDRVRVGDQVGTVLAVDRRKRTVEVDAGGDVTVAAFDDVQIQETT